VPNVLLVTYCVADCTVYAAYFKSIVIRYEPIDVVTANNSGLVLQLVTK